LSKLFRCFISKKALYEVNPTENNKQLFVIMRDSLIQRFEYCTDLIWKVLKAYLEEIEKVDVAGFSPRLIVRAAVHAGLFSESEGNDCMKTIESRNKTSHIYHQEMAQIIADKVPESYALMQKITDRIQKVVKI
jgi:nucleotidyltransferase substrate binding protein (TIGR01987 family)